eukprot:TRINITY_DN96194_c0_g1_i1.p1 TRINITY_DN96194_c0_g1~~TRINITY_DN96194_c0_g1_i1.p1  ORF type:complete len:281 (-),score=105.22 TRINITY_DN96194_c0_g1_i1:75-917(-)
MGERVCEECWENQRHYVLKKWSDELMFTDRPHWSSEDGTEERTKEAAVLPSGMWRWESDWQLDLDRRYGDKNGWRYASDFSAKAWYNEPRLMHFVRRRRWFRWRVKRDLVAEMADDNSDDTDRGRTAAAANADDEDKDDDNNNDQDEIGAAVDPLAMPEIKREVSDIMREFDTDGDNVLSRAELAQFLAKHQKQQKQQQQKQQSEQQQQQTPSSSVHITTIVNEDSHVCKVCLENEINCVALPCGHLSMCIECAESVFEKHKACPICRAPCTQIVRTFKS